MKKQFGAMLALAVCSTVAQAQSNATIYGTVDQYFGYIKSNSGAHIVGLNDGTLLRSRLGFRGTEDVGGGFQVKFNVEQGLNADTGAAADASRLFDRQSWVGVNTPAGEFRLGRQNTAIFYIGDAIDYTGRTTFGSVVNTFGLPSRYDNDISYKSPRLSNVQLEAHYALTEKTGEGSRGIYQLGLDYSNAPYRAGYAGMMAKPLSSATIADKIVYHTAYGDWDYGQGKVYLAFVRSNNSTASATGNNAATIIGNVNAPNNSFAGTDANVRRMYNIYQVSADYRLSPQLRLGALLGVMRDTSGGDAGAKGGNAGALYNLSKRTTLYGFANYMKNAPNAGFRFSGSGAPSANLSGADVNGKRLVGLQAGILHTF